MLDRSSKPLPHFTRSHSSCRDRTSGKGRIRRLRAWTLARVQNSQTPVTQRVDYLGLSVSGSISPNSGSGEAASAAATCDPAR